MARKLVSLSRLVTEIFKSIDQNHLDLDTHHWKLSIFNQKSFEWKNHISVISRSFLIKLLLEVAYDIGLSNEILRDNTDTKAIEMKRYS